MAISNFSFYSKLQSDFLIRFSTCIKEELDSALSDEAKIDCTDFNDIWGKIWLWVLGSYEIVRTMDQYNSCFSARMHPLIKKTKILLADLRIPMAKQEKRGIKTGIVFEPSVSSINFEKKDFGFEVNGETLYFKELVGAYERLIGELKPNDVLNTLDSHRKSQVNKRL